MKADSRVIEYRTLEASTANELDKIVRAWLDDGFEPYGDPDNENFDCGKSRYRQTVVKYSTKGLRSAV